MARQRAKRNMTDITRELLPSRNHIITPKPLFTMRVLRRRIIARVAGVP